MAESSSRWRDAVLPSWMMLFLLLPLAVQAGFPKAANLKLNLSVNANSASGEPFRAYGKMILVLKEGATITFRGDAVCDGTEEVQLFYWLITSDCVGLLDSAKDSVLRNPNRTHLRILTKPVSTTVVCSGVGAVHPINMTALWKTPGSHWNALCGPSDADSKTTTSPSVTTAPRTVPVTLPTQPAATRPQQGNGNARKREAQAVPPTAISTTPKTGGKGAGRKNVVCVTRTADVHALVLLATIEGANTLGDKKPHAELTITVTMKNKWGYLSAVDYPNLAFYAVMTAVYSIFAFAWLILLMVQYRDLLRIQFWIGGVIALGMIEKALFFSEYNTVNQNGNETVGLMVLAELVSTGKRTLARLLIIIVSMGFGIVKPRLGPMLPRVLAVGVLYFVAGTVDSAGRALHNSEVINEREDLATTLVLTVIDAGICWWIFLSLHSTMRTLRLRRNLVKLSLYRHFTNTLIFAVIASVAFMIWTLKQFRMTKCNTDWSEIWLRQGFWHILFSFILMIIMILWRPTANNNRYAYSPLIDLGSNEDPEQMPSDAFEGMKLRNVGGTTERKITRSVEDDLKWVEENIPTAAAETALPSLLDSDEELMTTKFEMSKIQ